MARSSTLTFVARCRQSKIAVRNKRPELRAFLQGLPGKPQLSQFTGLSNGEAYAALAWAIQTCRRPHRWASLPGASASLLRRIFKPPGSTPQTTMSNLARLWHQALHEAPAQPVMESSAAHPPDCARRIRHAGSPIPGVSPGLIDDFTVFGDTQSSGNLNVNAPADHSGGILRTFSSQRSTSPFDNCGRWPSNETRHPPDNSTILDADVSLGRPPVQDLRRSLPKSWFDSLFVAKSFGVTKMAHFQKAQTDGFYDTLVERDPEWGFQAGFNLDEKTDFDARRGGELLAIAARFPLPLTAGALPHRELSLDGFRYHWQTLEDCLRTRSELPSTILHAVQN